MLMLHQGITVTLFVVELLYVTWAHPTEINGYWHIVSIIKDSKGLLTDEDNYRPVAITNVASEVFF